MFENSSSNPLLNAVVAGLALEEEASGPSETGSSGKALRAFSRSSLMIASLLCFVDLVFQRKGGILSRLLDPEYLCLYAPRIVMSTSIFGDKGVHTGLQIDDHFFRCGVGEALISFPRFSA